MKYLIVLFFGFSALLAEGLEDRNFIRGKLPNGLTYYIRHNGKPKEKAFLRLVVKVGSIYEEEEERGLAHFIEHMVFRGSEHLADGEAERYAQSLGAWEGVDTNAYTSFESTVYKLDLPIEDKAALKQGLFILSEFAGRATFPQECVDKEKTVILDEMNRSLSSAKKRKGINQLLSLVENSIYGKRLPIGTEEVITNCTSEKLKAFYRKWYRPDRMAVIVVGDCSSDEAIALIHECFGELPSAEGKVKEPSKEISFPERERAFVYVDPALTATSFAMNAIYRNEPTTSINDIEMRFQGVSELLRGILKGRLEKLCTLHPDIFLHVWVDDDDLTDFYKVQTIGAVCFEGRLQEAMEIFSNEVHRFFASGITTSEWLKVKSRLLTYVSFAMSKLSEKEHDDFIDDYIDNFLSGEVILDDQVMMSQILSGIEKLAASEAHVNFINPRSLGFILSVATPSMRIVEMTSNQELLRLVTKGKHGKFSLPAEETTRDWLAVPKFGPGEIVEQEDLGSGITAWTLGNGMRVLIKPTDLKKGEMNLFLAANGGFAGFSEEEMPSAALAPSYLMASGVGNLSGEEFRDFSRHNLLNFEIGMRSKFRYFSGSSLNKGGQSLIFEFIHAFFTEPHLKIDKWDSVVKQAIERNRQQLNDPRNAFFKFIKERNTQGHFLFKTPDYSKAEEGVARKCLERFECNPQDFTALIVGDVNIEKVQEWTLQYLASIPRGSKPPLVNTPINSLFPHEIIHDVFAQGNPQTCETVISIPVNFAIEDETLAKAVLNLLEDRLTERMRVQMGGTYGVGVQMYSPLYPDVTQNIIQIFFTSNLKEIDSMLQALFEEVGKLKSRLPSSREVENLQKMLKNADRNERESNTYWVNKMINRLFGRIDPEPNFMFTAEDMQRMAEELFLSSIYTIFSHMPVDKHESVDKKDLPPYPNAGN